MVYTRTGDFLIGLIGLALLRGRIDDRLGSRAFCDARLDDLRRVLAHWDAEPALHDGVECDTISPTDGYALWAPRYDADPNPLIDLDRQALEPRLRRQPPGRALDVACGTGRWAAYLAQRGHVVAGVDASPAMLAIAQAKLPGARFDRGELDHLPHAAGSIDLLVCSLALAYAPDLGRAFGEFARVLRPGGCALVSDMHHLSLPLGGIVRQHLADGRTVRLRTYQRLPTDYISAGLAAGLSLVDGAEVPWPDLPDGGGPTAQRWCPDAARAAYVGTPALLTLEFRRPDPGGQG